MILATDTVASLALRCWKGGLSVLPLLPGTSLVPAINTWRHFLQCQPNQAALTRFETSDWLVGIATGQVSGGLEVLDFEHGEDWHEFRELVQQRQPGLLDGLPLATSVAGVTHLYYRCENPWSGLLAVQPLPQELSIPVLRVYAHGDHSFVPAPDNGRGLETWRLEQASGPPLETIPRIEVAEQRMLHEMAARLDRSRSLQATPRTKEIAEVSRLPGNTGITVREDFDRRGHWDEVLLAAGWPLRFCRHGGLHYWADPRSAAEHVDVVSGVQRHVAPYMIDLTPPSRRLQPWPSQRDNWSLFEAYTALVHQGDDGQAGRALWDLGFGSEPDASWVEGYQQLAEVPAPSVGMKEQTRLTLGALWRFLRNRTVGPPSKALATSSETLAPAATPATHVEQDAAAGESRALALLSSREIGFGDIRTPYLVADMVVAGRLSFVTGGDAFQRNTLMADLAFSVAQGVPFLENFEIVGSARRVLFIVEESLRAELMELSRQNAVSRGTDLRQVEDLYWSSESVAALLDTSADRRRLLDRLAEERIDLLLVDQPRQLNCPAEDDCWSHLQRTATLSGAAVVCVLADEPGLTQPLRREATWPVSTDRIHVDPMASEASTEVMGQFSLSRMSAVGATAGWEVVWDRRGHLPVGTALWTVRDK